MIDDHIDQPLHRKPERTLGNTHGHYKASCYSIADSFIS